MHCGEMPILDDNQVVIIILIIIENLKIDLLWNPDFLRYIH